MFLLGNHADKKVRKVKSTFHKRKEHLEYYDILTNSQYNLDKPFISLVWKLSGDTQFHFVETSALQPPGFQFDEETKKKYEAELILLLMRSPYQRMMMKISEVSFFSIVEDHIIVVSHTETLL